MRLALFVSILSSILTLNAETIQGKVVRVADGDTTTIQNEARTETEKVRLWKDANPMPPWEFRGKKNDGGNSPAGYKK